MPDAVLVGDLRAVYPGLYHEPFSVHQQVTLPTAHLLAAVEAPLLAAHPGRLGRLHIHDTGAGLRISTEMLPQPPPYRPVQPLSQVPSMRQALK